MDVETHARLGDPIFRAQATAEYLANHTGIMTNTGGDVFGWEKLPSPERDSFSQRTKDALAKFPPDWPELEYITLDAYVGRQLNYVQDAPEDGANYAAPIVAIVAPSSRGNVTISSKDTIDNPVISPNLLTDPADVELAVVAYKRLRQLMDLDVMKAITIGEEVYPGRNVTSDEDILEVIKESCTTVLHASATCE